MDDESAEKKNGMNETSTQYLNDHLEKNGSIMANGIHSNGTVRTRK